MDKNDRFMARKPFWMTGGWGGHEGTDWPNQVKRRLRAMTISAWSCAIEERDRWPLFAPVALGIGIGLYFDMGSEPSWLLLCLFGVVPSAGLWLMTKPTWIGIDAESSLRHAGIVLSVAALLAVTGMVSAKVRTVTRAAPILSDAIGPVELEGHLIGASKQEGGGWRLLIKPDRIEKVPPDDLPAIVRISVRQKDLSFRPGQTLRVWGELMPPPDPVAPYAFDFARQSYFRQIGAVGFAFGAPDILNQSAQPTIRERISIWVGQLRLSLADRIRAQLPGETGAIAAALMTGDRDVISEETKESLRVAGLAHLLAISGLHMALFGGLVFAACRFILAAIEPIALRANIKKWSAILGWAASLAYLILTGASISTQRAFIMISLMFLAVLIDRAALSMRSVTAAGFVILLLSPESLLDVSFQMSFSAVILLVAFYEAQRDRRHLQPHAYRERSSAALTMRKLGLHILGIGLTTVVAEAATGPFAAFHFNRVAGYGLIGNLLVMPLVGVLIMPFAVLAFLLMPFGLEQIALTPMGWGIDWLLAVSARISSWQGAEWHVRSWPTGALVTISLGGVWMAFWRTRWRFYGLILIAFGIGQALLHKPPDILIDRDGRNVAVKQSDGQLTMVSNRRARFAAESWARRNGQSPKSKVQNEFSCDSQGCILHTADLPHISFVMSAAIAEEECQRTDILIARVSLPRRFQRICRDNILVIDRFDLWRYGAHAIWVQGNDWHVEHAAGVRGDRPWSPAKR